MRHAALVDARLLSGPLFLGSPEQIWHMNAAGTAPEWTNALADLTTIESSGAAVLDTGGAGSSFGGALTIGGISEFQSFIVGSTSNGYVGFLGDIGASQVMRWTDAGSLFLGESTNANMTRGLTINQGANDNELIAGKSSRVSHGMTGEAETDTWFYIKKNFPSGGGLYLAGLTDDATTAIGIRLDAFAGGADSTQTSSSEGAITLDANENIAGTPTALVANDNLLAVRNQLVTRFIVTAQGDLFAGGGTSTTAVTVFDGEDDASMVRAFDMARAANGAHGFSRSEWDEFVTHKEADLVAAGILGAPLAEGGLTNFTRLVQLHNGAIGQVFDLVRELKARLVITESKLLALEA